jgi:hypothetical protein
MPRRALLLAAALAVFAAGLAVAAAAPDAAARPRIYRIELAGGGVIFSDDAPLQSGEQILFHGHPPGSLQSLRRADVKRIVATSAASTPGSVVKPGQAVDLGVSGPGTRGRPVGPGKAPPRGNTALRPGEGKGATALFNPDRTYRPDWDGKLVPGATMGLPNSPNDYREGATLAHPAASATQSAPGEPPMMKPSSGEPPKAPNN